MPRAPSFTKVGLPFFAFMIGGYYGLSQFVTGKVERNDLKVKSQSQREFNLEEEHAVRTISSRHCPSVSRITCLLPQKGTRKGALLSSIFLRSLL